jgi:hypothetical protein
LSFVLRDVDGPDARHRPSLSRPSFTRASVGRGWCFPAGVVLRNGDRCLVPGDDARSFGIARCVAPGRSPRGGRSGRHVRIVMGAERSSSYESRFSSDFRGRAAPRQTAREARRECGRTSKGNKAQGRTGCGSIGNGRARFRTRRRSNAPKSRLRSGGAPRCSPATVDVGGSGRCDGQRQGGNGHGDVVRLPARNSFEGCEKALRGRHVRLPPSIGLPVVGLGDGGGPKRSEPQDRQRDATSPRPPSGGNRRGGAKPRGRNVTPEMVSLEPKQAATPAGVDARQCRWRGEGCPCRAAAKAVVRCQHRRIPREEVDESPTRAADECSEGGPRPRGSARDRVIAR